MEGQGQDGPRRSARLMAKKNKNLDSKPQPVPGPSRPKRALQHDNDELVHQISNKGDGKTLSAEPDPYQPELKKIRVSRPPPEVIKKPPILITLGSDSEDEDDQSDTETEANSQVFVSNSGSGVDSGGEHLSTVLNKLFNNRARAIEMCAKEYATKNGSVLVAPRRTRMTQREFVASVRSNQVVLTPKL